MVNENALSLTRKQTKNHVDRLNDGDIGAEWEVVVLNVFGKLGNVVHEPTIPNSKKKIDIKFDSEIDDLNFIADVTTVSDEGIDVINPMRQFDDRMSAICLKHNLRGAWRYDIGGNSEEVNRNQGSPRLLLPPLSRFDAEIFDTADFVNFIDRIKECPAKPDSLRIAKLGVDLAISYAPSDRWTTLWNPALDYKALSDRGILGALQRKYSQVSSIAYTGFRGIILCDGGCDYLYERAAPAVEQKRNSVIWDFLDDHSGIEFVLVLSVEWHPSGNKECEVVARLFDRRDTDKRVCDFFNKVIGKLSVLFPIPHSDPANAVSFLRAVKHIRPHEGQTFWGGFQADSNSLRISSRSLLYLMTGRLSQSDFLSAYGLIAEYANKGRLFSGIKIETIDENDDDWLEITFSKPDPAVCPFRVPDK